MSQVQWFLMPLADMLFGSFAGLEAQFHMAITPTMKYEVSAKLAKAKTVVPSDTGAPAKSTMYENMTTGESPRYAQGSANTAFTGKF